MTIEKHLLLFLDNETVPPTNHSSEQALRWSVVFRKVTHGFCSDWGAELFAQVRSLVIRLAVRVSLPSRLFPMPLPHTNLIGY
ncbi:MULTISPECIES: IS66 family transposase [unclassified Microcoleus]|uniref:IS66 family transposase n=1 Tax=unclassified Microcoleus TaxID=2642155 RepID=UPI004040B033